MRRISNRELADLSENWENPTVDTSKYYQCVLRAFEITEKEYEKFKRNGRLVQKVKLKYYLGG